MDAELEPGSVFAGHRIEAVAGRGGMGIVYRAHDPILDRTVALKLISPALARDAGFRARFRTECRAAASLDHPHVVPVFRAGQHEGQLYVTMRFVAGVDLSTLIRRETRLPPSRALRLGEQVAGALDAAHAHGMVHRDVKPANVIVTGRDGAEQAFLTDFGLARGQGERDGLAAMGLVVGSAGYIAPEQARGEPLDGRADVYSFGCLLFHALTGRAPFVRPTAVETMLAHLHDPPPSARALCGDVPQAVDDVLRRALAKDPGERPATAGELVADALGDAAGQRLRVVVAEDSLLLRAGVVRLLEEGGFDVVAAVGDGEQLVQAVCERRPDVAVTDVRMPPTHSDEGLRAAGLIRERAPETAVLVLSQHVEEAYAVELLAEGAHGRGYLLKERVAEPAAFTEAVREVARGGSVVDPEVLAYLEARGTRPHP
jgi:CheY-like chemotaxis protein